MQVGPERSEIIQQAMLSVPQRPGWLLQLTSIWDWPEESLSPWREPTPMLRVRYAGGWRSPWVESSRYPS